MIRNFSKLLVTLFVALFVTKFGTFWFFGYPPHGNAFYVWDDLRFQFGRLFLFFFFKMTRSCGRRRARPLVVLLAALDVCGATLILSQLSATVLESALGWALGGGKDHVPSGSGGFPVCGNGTAPNNGTSPPCHRFHPFLPVKTVFSLGGATIDLWLWSVVRFLSVVLSVAWVQCADREGNARRWWRFALAALLAHAGALCYVVVKCLLRLIDGPASGSPPDRWFWSMIATSTVSALPICQLWLWCLHDFIHAMEETADAAPSLRGRVPGAPSASIQQDGLQSPLLVADREILDLSALARGRKPRGDGEKKVDGNGGAEEDDEDDGGGGTDDDDDDKEAHAQEALEFAAAGERYSGTVGDLVRARALGLGPNRKRLAWFQKDPKGNKKKKKSDTSASVSKLLKLAIPDISWMLTAFVALLIAAVGQSMIPYLTGQIINKVAGDKDIGELRSATTMLAVTAAITAVFTALRGSIFTLTMAKLNVRVRNEFFKSLLSQELGFFDTHKTGDITSRLSADTTKMSDQVSLNLNVLIRSIVQSCGVLFFMFRLSVRLSLVTFVSVPCVVVLSKGYGAYYRTLTKAGQKTLASANCIAEESLSSMATVKSFAAERGEARDYARKLDKYYDVNVRMAIAYTVYAVLFTVLPNLVTALVLFYGGKLVIEGELQPGDLVSFMLFQQNLSSAFNTIGNIWTGISGALGAADKVFEYIARKPKIVPGKERPSGSPATSSSPEKTAGLDVNFQAVTLRYPSRPDALVLCGVTLRVVPGEVVALVGPSGGGKSSCLRLINGLYTAASGQVLLDGLSVHDYDHGWYHRRVSIVGQEPVLFARSIRRNILYGLEDGEEAEEGRSPSVEPTMEDVVRAARLANAHDFIMDFPKQYLTLCGEKGADLSGGQKQRIAIARALVRSPSVLLLDEATSALDTESEAVVQQALDDVMRVRSMTTIVVAHRLSTVKNANRIVVIDKGAVQEVGTHHELLSRPGSVYRSLVKRQLEGPDAD